VIGAHRSHIRAYFDPTLMRSPILALVLTLLYAALADAQPAKSAQSPPLDHRAQLAAKFRDRLAEIARATNGVVGVSVIDLASGERFGVNDTLVFPQGSAIKIPILVELFRQADAGTLRLDEKLAVTTTDQVAGTGVSQWFGDGLSSLSLRDLSVLMIVLSDNTATNMLIGKVGMRAVTNSMASMGLGTIKLQRLMIRPRESAIGSENVASATQAAELMRRIHTCQLPMSRARCDELRRILELPKGGEFPSSVPPSVRVAWKPGTVEGVATSWGLFALPANPYVVTAMVNFSDDRPASAALRELADATYEYFHRVARASAFGVRVPAALVDSIRRPPPREKH